MQKMLENQIHSRYFQFKGWHIITGMFLETHQFKESACNLCKGTSYRFKFRKNGYSLVQCQTCSLVYVINQPSLAELETLYSVGAGYHAGYSENKISDGDLKAAKDHYRFVEEYGSKDRLLDIGCSRGSFLKIAKDGGWEVRGIDLSKGCSHKMMLRGECGAAILVEVSPELFPAACGESQRTYRQYGESAVVLPTRTRFA